MPMTIDDRNLALAKKAVDWYVRDGIPDERIRAVVMGEGRDEELEALKALRDMLHDAATRKAIIGTHAYDLLRATPWGDAEVTACLEGARVTSTRATLAVTEELAALFAQVLSDASEQAIADGSPRDARRYKIAAETLAKTASEVALAAA